MMLYLSTLSISHRQENCEHQIVTKFNQVLHIISQCFYLCKCTGKKDLTIPSLDELLVISPTCSDESFL